MEKVDERLHEVYMWMSVILQTAGPWVAKPIRLHPCHSMHFGCTNQHCRAMWSVFDIPNCWIWQENEQNQVLALSQGILPDTNLIMRPSHVTYCSEISSTQLIWCLCICMSHKDYPKYLLLSLLPSLVQLFAVPFSWLNCHWYHYRFSF